MTLSKAGVDGIGYVAATMTTTSFVPQLIRVVKLRSARDISLGMFVIMAVGTALWLVFGILSHSTPIIFANAVTVSLSIAVLVLKLRFDRNAIRKTQPDGAPR
jgi:MtN3 and saliva related transmembrane protein